MGRYAFMWQQSSAAGGTSEPMPFLERVQTWPDTFANARGINDDGVIVGWTHSGGQTVGFTGSASRGYELLVPPGGAVAGALVYCQASTMPVRWPASSRTLMPIHLLPSWVHRRTNSLNVRTRTPPSGRRDRFPASVITAPPCATISLAGNRQLTATTGRSSYVIHRRKGDSRGWEIP
jgi:hypothetical protein